MIKHVTISTLNLEDSVLQVPYGSLLLIHEFYPLKRNNSDGCQNIAFLIHLFTLFLFYILTTCCNPI